LPHLKFHLPYLQTGKILPEHFLIMQPEKVRVNSALFYPKKGAVIFGNGVYLFSESLSLSSFLIWKPEYSLGQQTPVYFQLQPTPEVMNVCLDIQTDGPYNLVQYNLDDQGHVISLEIPGLDYGMVFVKQ
jgi:hypothetical protein